MIPTRFCSQIHQKQPSLLTVAIHKPLHRYRCLSLSSPHYQALNNLHRSQSCRTLKSHSHLNEPDCSRPSSLAHFLFEILKSEYIYTPTGVVRVWPRQRRGLSLGGFKIDTAMAKVRNISLSSSPSRHLPVVQVTDTPSPSLQMSSTSVGLGREGDDRPPSFCQVSRLDKSLSWSLSQSQTPPPPSLDVVLFLLRFCVHGVSGGGCESGCEGGLDSGLFESPPAA